MSIDFSEGTVRDALSLAALFYTAGDVNDAPGAMGLVTAAIGSRISASVDSHVHPPRRLPKTTSQWRDSVEEVISQIGTATAEFGSEMVHALSLTLIVLAESRQCSTEEAVTVVIDRLLEVRS